VGGGGVSSIVIKISVIMDRWETWLLGCVFSFFLADLNPDNFTLSSARIYIPRTTRPYIKVINLSHPLLCLAGLPDCDGSLNALFCTTPSHHSHRLYVRLSPY
jgi:hypothetical protein